MIHPVFHVSVLKSFKGDASQPYMPISLLTNEKGPLLQPIKVLDCGKLVIMIKNRQQIPQVLL